MSKKRNLWPLLFIAIFGFTFSMIVWTIVKSSQANLDTDDSFVSNYHNVDENYNEMIIQTQKFLTKYDMKLISNQKDIALDNNDMFLRQAAKNKNHENLFVVGDNKLIFLISDKQGQIQSNVSIKAVFTSSTSNSQKQIIDKLVFADGKYVANLKIDKIGNYNISGEVSIGSEKAYFFIKSNAVSK